MHIPILALLYIEITLRAETPFSLPLYFQCLIQYCIRVWNLLCLLSITEVIGKPTTKGLAVIIRSFQRPSSLSLEIWILVLKYQ